MVKYTPLSSKTEKQKLSLTRAMQAFSLLRNRKLSVSNTLLSLIIKAIGSVSRRNDLPKESKFANIPFIQARSELDALWMFGIDKKYNNLLSRNIFHEIIITAGKIGHPIAIQRALQFMNQQNITPNVPTFVALLRAFSYLQEPAKCLSSFQKIIPLIQQNSKQYYFATSNKAFHILCSGLKKSADIPFLLKAFQDFSATSNLIPNSLSSATLAIILDTCLQCIQNAVKVSQLKQAELNAVASILLLTETYASKLSQTEQQFINQKKEDVRDFIEADSPL